MRRLLIATILILALITQFGCASSVLSPPPSEAVRSGLGTVAVTSGRFAPRLGIVGGPARGAGASAGRGAVVGAVVPIAVGSKMGGSGAILGIMLAPVGAVVGAIAGVIQNEPTVKVEEREAAARELAAAQRIQDDIRDRVAAVGRDLTPHTLTVLADQDSSIAAERPDYRPLSQEAIQTVLDVRLESVTLEGGELPIDPPLWLVMVVNTRLVRTDNNAELYANSLTYTGQKGRTLAEWVGDPEVFRDELDRAYVILAEKIVEEVFLLIPLTTCATCPVAGLRPLYPEAGPSFSQVNSLQPTFRWEAFPRPTDLDADRDGWVRRIREVTYDVRIWKVELAPPREFPTWWLSPGELFYSRSALSAPTHTIDLPLALSTSYFWSVRARFDLDGQQRVTEWSVLLESDSRQKYNPRTARIPALNYYRVRTATPSEEPQSP